MREIIEYLNAWKVDLESQTTFSSTEHKANHIGLISYVDSAVRLLELCTLYDISPGSWFCMLPDPVVNGYHQAGFRIVCDNETHVPADWSEVLFEKYGKLLLRPGDVVIKK